MPKLFVVRNAFIENNTDSNLYMFKWNGKIWDPKNPEKKLKQLGITWDDVEIIESLPVKQKTANDEIDIERIKTWWKIYDFNTGSTYVTIDKSRVIERIKHALDLSKIIINDTHTIYAKRYYLLPYTDELLKTIDDIDVWYKTAEWNEGYTYTSYGLYKLDEYILNSDYSFEEICEKLKVIDKEKFRNYKTIPYKEYITYYKTHSSNQVKEHFGLDDEQYKTIQRKYFLNV